MFNLGVFKMLIFDFKMALKRSFFVRLSSSFGCDLTLTLPTCRLSFVKIGDKKFENVPRVPPLVRKIFFCSDPNETWSAGRDSQGKVTAGRGAQSGLKPGRNRYFSFQNIGFKVARFSARLCARFARLPLRGASPCGRGNARSLRSRPSARPFFGTAIKNFKVPGPEEIFFLPGEQAQSAAQEEKNRPVCTYKFLKAGQKKGRVVVVVPMGPIIAFEF